jgi:ABC-2 type transport system ATP-binding protein
MSSAVKTEHLSRSFGKLAAVNDLNLDIPEGAIYALVGPNGAGKTTAIKILMNILPPTSGRAEVLGLDSSNLRGKAFTSIGHVSENQRLPDWMRVSVFLDYLRPFYTTWDRDLEKELIKQFQLPLDRKLGKLSRGMRMKAALASSLAYHPKLIVLDEPFGGLDPLVRDELIESLVERAAEATIFISSHDLAEIENLASHIGYLEQGRLQLSEEIALLSERFREVELTLDHPGSTLPDNLPASWMHVNQSAAVVRFVESRFDENHTNDEIQKRFGRPRNVTFTPMPLRAIFLALAKAGRTQPESKTA